jgi:hypothetical protein
MLIITKEMLPNFILLSVWLLVVKSSSISGCYIPSKRSMTNSTSLSGGIPGNSSGKTSGISLTTQMFLPTNFPSTRYMAGLVKGVMVISTSNLYPFGLVSPTVPLAQCMTAFAFLNHDIPSMRSILLSSNTIGIYQNSLLMIASFNLLVI